MEQISPELALVDADLARRERPRHVPPVLGVVSVPSPAQAVTTVSWSVLRRCATAALALVGLLGAGILAAMLVTPHDRTRTTPRAAEPSPSTRVAVPLTPANRSEPARTQARPNRQ